MDRTIPQAAAHILDFIAGPESKGDYDAISSFKQHLLPKKLTSMTVDEVLTQGPTWRTKYGTLSSAAGRYQIINATLRRLVGVMNLKGTEKFSPDLQDRMAMQLLRFRGYDQYMAGQISLEQFGKNLAQEWASLPVLAGTKNYKGANIQRGTSYYAGDGLNQHGVSAAAFERALQVHEGEVGYIDPDDFKETLVDASTLPASTNVKPAPSKTTVVATVATAASAGAAVVGGSVDATKTVTDWSPVIDLAVGVGRYGPWVAGVIVAGVVVTIIARKVWKG